MKNKSIFKKLFICLVIFLPSIVRILLFNETRIHGDDMLTAYFSAHYNFFKTNPFSPIPQSPTDWVCQFPSPFFIVQKIFFLIFGESLLSIKLSIVPYVIMVSVFLYLLTKKLLGKNIALISVFLYSFFSPALYLETLGLHFVSSTAVFIVFFYFLVLNFISKKIKYAVLSGIFLALCYLTYSSSYIAYPVFIIFFVGQIFFKEKRLATIRNYLFIFIVSLIVLSPFIFEMWKSRNFYLTKRFAQVSLISGEWSNTSKSVKTLPKIFEIVFNNFKLSFWSLHQDGVGGHGGYNFGKLAFFNQFNLFLFCIGLFSSLYLIMCRKKIEYIFVLIVICISFFTGIVLTIPPPAFHRFSLAFPFIALVLSIPFSFMPRVFKNKLISFSLAAIILLLFSVNNLDYFKKQTASENNQQDVVLSKFIKKTFFDRNIYVASFPGFVFEKTFYFFNGFPRSRISTDYHINLLKRFNTNEKYLYIIIFPQVFNDQFIEKDPNGKIQPFSDQYSLFFN